uniref:Uncharacterized protein n=1 Tax=Parascaris univalens TaxID=6257 RepID=A0A915BMT6_PARUN
MPTLSTLHVRYSQPDTTVGHRKAQTSDGGMRLFAINHLRNPRYATLLKFSSVGSLSGCAQLLYDSTLLRRN